MGGDITRAEARSRLGRILDWIRNHGTTQARKSGERKVQPLSLQSLGLSEPVGTSRPASSSSTTVRRSRPRVRTLTAMPKPKEGVTSKPEAKSVTSEPGSEPDPEAPATASKAVSVSARPPKVDSSQAPETDSTEVRITQVKKKSMPTGPPKPTLRKAAVNAPPIDLSRFAREAGGGDLQVNPSPRRSIFYIEDQLDQMVEPGGR